MKVIRNYVANFLCHAPMDLLNTYGAQMKFWATIALFVANLNKCLKLGFVWMLSIGL
jgi:hypothetical protein